MNCILASSLIALALAKPIAFLFDYKVFASQDLKKLYDYSRGCEKIIIIDDKHIPTKFDIELKKEGKKVIRIYNDLGEFYFIFSRISVDRIYFVDDIWNCSFVANPVIINNSSLKYLKTLFNIKINTNCPTLPMQFIKIENVVLKKYNYTLEGYSKVVNL